MEPTTYSLASLRTLTFPEANCRLPPHPQCIKREWIAPLGTVLAGFRWGRDGTLLPCRVCRRGSTWLLISPKKGHQIFPADLSDCTMRCANTPRAKATRRSHFWPSERRRPMLIATCAGAYCRMRMTNNSLHDFRDVR